MPSTKRMTPDSPSIEFPNRYQRESLALVNKLLPVGSAAFYLVDPDMQHRGVVLHNLEARAEREYAENFRDLDPLNPARFADREDTVVCLDEQLSEDELIASTYYRDFMQPLGHRYVSDMFFRREGKIIAVLTMLRGAVLGPFSEAELALLRNLQPFLQYTLNTVYLHRRVQQREGAKERFGLTEREVDVVELIIAGANNKTIARELGLSLSTVKTHLQHAFHKTGVSSRTELSALILGRASD